jgi:hypothetical protein
MKMPYALRTAVFALVALLGSLSAGHAASGTVTLTIYKAG